MNLHKKITELGLLIVIMYKTKFSFMNLFKFLLNIFYERFLIRNTHLTGSADLTVTQIINLPT